MDHLCYFCLVMLCFHARLFCWCLVVTCWERADLLALVCDVYCDVLTFPLVSWVRCGAWLYQFLILPSFLRWIIQFAISADIILHFIFVACTNTQKYLDYSTKAKQNAGTFEPHHENPCFCFMGTTKALTRLCIHTVKSAPLFFTLRKVL